MHVRPFTTALVLGGGGARGLAHLGVLRALEHCRIRPDMIVGTSMGAILGAAYALSADAETLIEEIQEHLNRDTIKNIEKRFEALQHTESAKGMRGRLQRMMGQMQRLYLWNMQAMREALIDSEVVDELITHLVQEASFDDVQIPIYAVAYDLAHHDNVIIGHGRLSAAVRASAAIPGVIEPLRHEDLVLVDGCVRQELPTESALKLGADLVIAVDVGRAVGNTPPSSAAGVLTHVSVIRGDQLRWESRHRAHCCIHPQVSNIHWTGFSRADECIAAGEHAAMAADDDIRQTMRRRRRQTLFRRWLGKPVPTTGIATVE